MKSKTPIPVAPDQTASGSEGPQNACTLSEAERAQLLSLIAEHGDQEGALLPLLHAIQDRFGYIPQASLEPIAQAMNRSRAEVFGVVSFYHHFRVEAPGRHVLQVCRAEACQSMGAEGLWRHADHGARSSDGQLTLLPVYCLGLCAAAPAVMLDGELHARVDAASLAQLLASARSAP